MNKKGFTLVELLAVIILLAVLAVIASTSVGTLLKDSKDSLYNSQLTSIEEAAKAWFVDNPSALSSANQCSYITLKDLKDYGLIETDIINPKTEKKFLNNMKIKISLEDVAHYGTEKISYEIDSDNVDGCRYFYRTICTLSEESKFSNKQIGAKYECEVKPGTKYNFYVLSQESDGTTNLIMERNICEDGTVATAENKCTVEWMSKTDYNDDTNYGEYGNNNKGPVTAMNILYNATKDWTNIPNMIMNYEDENIDYDTQEKGTTGYGTIITTNNITKITKKDGTVVTVLTDQEGYTNLKARLPRYNEVTGTGKCTTTDGSCPLYLVNYLSSSSHVTEEGLQNISGIYGYWTLSSFADRSSYAWLVSYNGDVGYSWVYEDYGVRPVITLPITELSTIE